MYMPPSPISLWPDRRSSFHQPKPAWRPAARFSGREPLGLPEFGKLHPSAPHSSAVATALRSVWTADAPNIDDVDAASDGPPKS